MTVWTYGISREEEEGVAAALLLAVPEGETSQEELEGHFGNPLVRLTRRVEKRPRIRAVWGRWSAAGVPAAIARDVEARLDEDGVLHFRLDKQAAYQERLELAKDSDPIDVRLKLIAYPAKPAEARRGPHPILGEAPGMRLPRTQMHLPDDGTESQRKAKPILLAVGRPPAAPRPIPITSPHGAGVPHQLIRG